MSLLEHGGNEEILDEAKVEPIAMVMRRLERFEQVKRREDTENIREVAEMKMEGKCLIGRPKLKRKDTVRRGMKAWTERDGNVSPRRVSPHRETTAKDEITIPVYSL